MSAEARNPEWRGRRPLGVLGGAAAAGFVLASAVGVSLGADAPAHLRGVWVPLSVALVAGAASTLRLALQRQEPGRPPARLWRAAGLLLASGLTPLVLLQIAFLESVTLGSASVETRVVTGWSSPLSAEECVRQGAGLDRCWPERRLILAAIGISYLASLAGIGALAGLGLTPAPSLGSGRVGGGGGVPEEDARIDRAAGDSPPLPPPYLDFDLTIEPLPEGLFRASARTSQRFAASVHFKLPERLADHRVGALRLGGQGATRGGSAAPELAPKEVGGALFKAVFQGEVLAGFRSGLASQAGGTGLRLRLCLEKVPELAYLPWEYLYDEKAQGFLACHRETPVVRFLERPEVVHPLAVEPPLRILVMISTPGDYVDLAQADREWEALISAFQPLVKLGKVVIDRVEPTIDQLQRRLRTGEAVHVFHFVGHGGFDETAREGVLVLEDGKGRGVPVKSEDFASLLKNARTLRLVVLNACNGALSPGDDVFAGTAQSLVERGGVPAVVAMQSEISDETARRFADCFYRALSDLLPVDTCICEARTALAAEGNPEWGTPVLYLRAADGQLFAPAVAVPKA